MKAIKINNEWKLYPKVPTVWSTSYPFPGWENVKDFEHPTINENKKIVSELNKCIETINSKTKVIMHTAFVGMPQEQLNHLHHYFEELRGASKNSADYYLNASPNERLALERYNVIIHRAENFYLENTINIKPWKNDNSRDHVLKDCLAIIK